MLPFLKGTRLYSILNSKCPKCQEGDFHVSKNAYDFNNFGKNHDYCSHCGFKYEQEPGFFYGAMYVSYALTVAFSVAIGVAIFVLFPSSSYLVYLISILVGLVVLMPLSFRLSRIIWLNLFHHYDEKLANKKEIAEEKK
ncbi:DUF983 domain-containing protein [Crocinitomix algicola]|uniref:DUF983 domain-containing protein n=1 Tax=Crocinitomix algicola TaxID=1740263 RepID=UPI000871FC14|nr:DUF983 domain-containing protein [Crocinitomix algicola]